MKNICTLLGLILCVVLKSKAQVVTEDVHFDFYQGASNNDFVNKFNGITGITQIQTNGITGGCLLLQDSIDWGNDRGIYCSTYKPQSGDTTITGISFKYDTADVNTASFQRAMTIFMYPWADPNHYVIATVSGTKSLELITYSWVNTPYPSLNLLHNHWYRYLLTTAFNAPLLQVYIKAEVFDLGLAGTGTPSLVNSSIHTISDQVLAVDTAISVAVSGAKYGGGIYLDDFSFHGRKGHSTCVVTGLEEQSDSDNLSVYPTPAANVLNVEGRGVIANSMISIYNVQGEKLLSRATTSEKKTEFNISELANGIYFIKISGVKGSVVKKFIKE